MDCNEHDSNIHDSEKVCMTRVPIFSHLTYEELIKITKVTTCSKYEKGEMIFLPGESSVKLFIIHKGKVKISRISISGREQILRILEPGDFMGELSLFGNSQLNSSAEALETTEVCVIHTNEIRKLVVVFPDIAIKILEAFSKRLEEAEGLIEQLGLQDVEQRLAGAILQLMKSEELDLTLSISKKDLASLIGTTQETLSRKLSAFQERGWIQLYGQRRILIQNLDALRQLHSR